VNDYSLPVVGVLDVGNGEPPAWAKLLTEVPFVAAVGRADVAAWLASELQRAGYAARAQGGFVHLPNTSARPVVEQLERCLPSLPEDVTLLGQADGVTYVQLPQGAVWQWTQGTWRFLCLGAIWPQTAIRARLVVGEES